MDLPTRTWPPTTTHFDAMLAVQQLPSKSKQKIVLPANGFSIEDRNPTSEHPEMNTNLHKPMDTHVDLHLEHLQNALGDHLHKDILSDCTEPKLQDSNFPSLQDQSHVWSLNKEQHNAFLLMGAAMLQHIHFTNQLADSEEN
ncbi:hypothetical protein DAPPUDRAFT_247721 [Daphnia pulex]|uniref:Uncharacterized protein n=1 Tax=Daphnia pulex TaxID=6669 RepID=E9GT95_DAPPU|nr:hypothetical protein DAPPUDRAFT_247721 [Daphnia pulex]|eukprot:EFX77237.1 hypothetical protein DAPPUDRAFT_247721 [Daphnia pulex]